MKTLEEILEHEKQYRTASGIYGIDACKESIISKLKISEKYNEGKTLYTLLEEFVKRANESVFFNNAMVLACWELINEKGE